MTYETMNRQRCRSEGITMNTHALVVSLGSDYGLKGFTGHEVVLFDSEESAVTFAVDKLVEANVFTRDPDGTFRDVKEVVIEQEFVSQDPKTALECFQEWLGSSEYFHVFQVVPAPGLPSATEEKTHEQLNSDCTSSEARALHRVVRAMHDGNCPKCGHLASADMFQNCQGSGHQCPRCKFRISAIEADAALAAFAPYMEQNVEMFEAWRKRRS